MILRLRQATPPDRVQALRERLERAGLRTVLSPESARPIVYPSCTAGTSRISRLLMNGRGRVWRYSFTTEPSSTESVKR